MRNSSFLLVVGTALIIQGCGDRRLDQIVIQEKQLAHLYPTNYEFGASVYSVKDAIGKAAEKLRSEDRRKYQRKIWNGGGDTDVKLSMSKTVQSSELGHLFWKGNADSLTKDTFTKPENENDAYIYGGDSPVGESQIYFIGGEPLIYFADFHIHLTVVAPERTRIEINTFDSFVVVGLEKRRSTHGPRRICVDVAPTTIEEYRILRGIGEEIGIRDMPPLVAPPPDSSIRQISRNRK